MKSFLLLIFYFSSLIPGSSVVQKTNPNENQQKHGLIIAVADYPREGRWPDISSDNDIKLIKSTLIKQGFMEENIKVILDSNATKDKIIKEFKNLKDRIKEGDVVVIHYSGHGQQIQDDNGDELDGYDESLIPYDAQVRFSEYYKGEKHLRDDELNVLLSELRQKLGPQGNLLLILDACHSGTASRGFAPSRGTNIKFQEEGYNPENSNDRGTFNEISDNKDQLNLAPMITMSGASAHELNYEYYDRENDICYGSLSYAVSYAFSNTDGNITYRSLFDKVKVFMSVIAPRQSPQIEGDIDLQLFGGSKIETAPYFMINKWMNAQNITINAGHLHGIYDSTEVALYPIGTYDINNTSMIAQGQVIFSSAIESDVLLEKPLSKETAINSWIFVTKQNFGDINTRIKIDIKKNTELEESLISNIKEIPKIEIVSRNPDLIIERKKEIKNKYKIQLLTSDELVLYSEFIEEGNKLSYYAEDITNKITHYLQVNLLKKIEMKSENIDIELEILPITVKKVGSRWIEDQQLNIESKRNEGGELVFKEGDCFKLKIINNGWSRVFYQILDIRPNNELGLLFPMEGDYRPAAEFMIESKQETILDPIFVFQEPYGKEFFKLIATETPIDLRSIIKTRGKDTRSSKSAFEQLFQGSYDQTRAGTLSVPPSSATVITIPLKVEKE